MNNMQAFGNGLVDKEWTDFLLEQSNSSRGHMSIPTVSETDTFKKNATSSSSCYETPKSKINAGTDVDGGGVGLGLVGVIGIEDDDTTSPICDELYISTKTKVLFFNTPIDIHTIFWEIPIIEYWRPKEGIIKKQIKIVSKTPEEFVCYSEKLKKIPYYIENIIKQIDNPDSRRIKFKDERKITVGISKKDVVNHRIKVKNAFYNCFALIYRIKYKGGFHEIHVKIFNTGKLEIPGVLNSEILDIMKVMIIETIQPRVNIPLMFIEEKSDDNILINSNFNCNYFINREKLFNILRSEKYGIESAYDPCSYPGVKCKFYFNNLFGFDTDLQNGKILTEDRSMKMTELKDNKKYTEISFMIFRTGSCLIVGNCSEKILNFVFDFVKKILTDEYQYIHVMNEKPVNKNKNTKIIKKIINVTKDYYMEHIAKNQ